MTHIVNVGYDSTNYYVLGYAAPRLLVDVGWPGTLPKLVAHLKRKDIPLQEICYLLVTHYHPDHAGLAQEIKAQGIQLIVLEPQIPALPLLKTYMKPVNPYVALTLHDNLRLSFAESRTFLKTLGISGEIISTPGHSDDSISLVLDEGIAFTGDLPPPTSVETTAPDPISLSWDLIRARKATTIYPGHGPTRPVPAAINE